MSYWGFCNDNGSWYGDDSPDIVLKWYICEVLANNELKYHKIVENLETPQLPEKDIQHKCWIGELTIQGSKAKLGRGHGWFNNDFNNYKLIDDYLIEIKQEKIILFERKVHALAKSMHKNWAIICAQMNICHKELAKILKVDIVHSSNKFESDISFKLSLFDLKTCIEIIELCKVFDISFDEAFQEFKGYAERFSLYNYHNYIITYK